MKFSFYLNFIDPLLKDLRKFIIEFGEIKKEEEVLDLGCGTGDQIFFIAQTGARGTGVDISQNMIEIANERKRKEKVENVCFQIGDATHLPFQNSLFDTVLISLVLHEVESKKRMKIISEMKRVAKNKGKLIFVDFNAPLPKTLLAFFVKIIEYLAGKENFANFQNYLQEGGLFPLLKRSNLRTKKIAFLKNKMLVIILAENQ